MATTQKKKGGSRAASSGGRRTASSSSSSRSRSSTSGSRKKQPPQPAHQPFRREIGAVACLLLALFSALGCFHIEALFIDFFCGLVKGLIGYGLAGAPGPSADQLYPGLPPLASGVPSGGVRPADAPDDGLHGPRADGPGPALGRSPAQDVVGERPGHDQRRRGRRSAGPGAGPGGERLGIHRGLCAGLPAHGPGGVPTHHSGCGRLDLQPAHVDQGSRAAQPHKDRFLTRRQSWAHHSRRAKRRSTFQ